MTWIGYIVNVEISTICRIMETATIEGKRFELKDIERLVGYYRDTWGPLFKQATGLTPANYVRMFRLRLVCKYLQESGGNIGMIFIDQGMDIQHMQRQFKKVFGITPRQFRNLSTLGALVCIESVFGNIEFQHDMTTSPPTLK